MFIDRAKVKFIAGKGGNGIVAWRREKYIPKGGPCGGNGGRGGSIILKADSHVASLDLFRNKRIFKAEDGGIGGPNKQQGKNGQHLILKVPCGTLVKNILTGDILCDLTEHEQEFKLCEGGRGGRGNDSFKTPTNRAPNICTEGTEGGNIEVELELKLIADIGLLGFPNAGKSTLIQSLAKVKVKIAPYPFTTLQPNLGYIEYDDFSRVFIADIPGIIEGAHVNRGLGFEFLRHIERTKVLLYVLDASGIDGRHPIDDFRILQNEIGTYDPSLLNRPCLIALNKSDVEESQNKIQEFKETYPLLKDKLVEISAMTGLGLDTLREALRILSQHPNEIEPQDWIS